MEELEKKFYKAMTGLDWSNRGDELVSDEDNSKDAANLHREIMVACQSSLISALEKDRDGYIHKRDGWKEGSSNYETYDLVVRVCE